MSLNEDEISYKLSCMSPLPISPFTHWFIDLTISDDWLRCCFFKQSWINWSLSSLSIGTNVIRQNIVPRAFRFPSSPYQDSNIFNRQSCIKLPVFSFLPLGHLKIYLSGSSYCWVHWPPGIILISTRDKIFSWIIAFPREMVMKNYESWHRES